MDEVRMFLPTWMNSSNFLELGSMKKPKGLPKYLVMSMLPRELTGVPLISNTVGMVDWWSEAMWTEKHLCGFTERPIRVAVSTRRLIESSKSCRVSSIIPLYTAPGPRTNFFFFYILHRSNQKCESTIFCLEILSKGTLIRAKPSNGKRGNGDFSPCCYAYARC